MRSSTLQAHLAAKLVARKSQQLEAFRAKFALNIHASSSAAPTGSVGTYWQQQNAGRQRLQHAWSSCRPVYCLVKPHWLATLTTSRTLPCAIDRDTLCAELFIHSIQLEVELTSGICCAALEMPERTSRACGPHLVFRQVYTAAVDVLYAQRSLFESGGSTKRPSSGSQARAPTLALKS